MTAARWRIALSLTVAMMVVYFGFILLVAFNKPLLGRLLAPGLSLGILLGALVIVAAWVLTWIYIRWANTHYDAHLRGLRSMIGGGETNVVAIGFFLAFIALSLGITVWAARKTQTADPSTRRAAASRRCRTASRSPATT